MSKKQLIALGVLIVLALGAGAAWYFTRQTPEATLAANTAALPPDAVQPGDKAMGSTNAPVTMIEYFSQGCSVCAGFDQQVFPLLKAKYIDSGKVRYVMRLLPIFPIDAPAYRLDLCVPPDKFFQSVDLLFRNQAKWDAAEFPVSDPHAGLLEMAAEMGLSAQQADACMNDTSHDAAINKVAQDAVTRYQPDGTPTLVVEFKKVDMPQKSWAEAQAALDAALAAKGVK
jgi:protein-disulfide isomerase